MVFILFYLLNINFLYKDLKRLITFKVVIYNNKEKYYNEY